MSTLGSLLIYNKKFDTLAATLLMVWQMSGNELSKVIDKSQADIDAAIAAINANSSELVVEEWTGVLKSTKSERFPSGYPTGITIINIETQDQNGNPMSCDFKFTRNNGASSIEVCSVASNPSYCGLEKQSQFLHLLLGGHDLDSEKK
jgi:hypothetical protein